MTPNHKNSDIISPLLKVRDDLPLQVFTKHVKGHQDATIPRHMLSPEAQLNVEMDKEAKQLSMVLINCPHLKPTYNRHPKAFPTCKHNDIVIEQQLTSCLYDRIMKDKMLVYWHETGRVQKPNQNLIDYNAMAAASKSMNMTMKRFMSKWSCNCLATGKNMVRWNYSKMLST